MFLMRRDKIDIRNIQKYLLVCKGLSRVSSSQSWYRSLYGFIRKQLKLELLFKIIKKTLRSCAASSNRPYHYIEDLSKRDKKKIPNKSLK